MKTYNGLVYRATLFNNRVLEIAAVPEDFVVHEEVSPEDIQKLDSCASAKEVDRVLNDITSK